MSDFRKILAELRRPRLLMNAVRHALADEGGARAMRRHAPRDTSPERLLDRLIHAESRLEETRREGRAGYSVAEHVEALVALIVTARRLGTAG